MMEVEDLFELANMAFAGEISLAIARKDTSVIQIKSKQDLHKVLTNREMFEEQVLPYPLIVANSSSYPPITPTSSGSSDNGDNIQPQHHGVANDQHHEHSSDYDGNSGDHHSTNSNNNQQHKHHSDGSGNSNNSNGSSDRSDNSDNSDDANNNAIIEITQ